MGRILPVKLDAAASKLAAVPHNPRWRGLQGSTMGLRWQIIDHQCRPNSALSIWILQAVQDVADAFVTF